ncbi:MAG TPA: helix-turn-helix domain-containing protein, partial [Solirubrobacterales bacterium]|nr:helix-turn-helix domain-containing protein [Solirubrobacterales bacterium]
MSGQEASGGTPAGKMTIGELARRTGMTIRNIRAHQTRGLLPPPEVHGRTGYYNEEHVARIELTREMQAEGLNLEAIRRVLETTDGSSREIVDFARAVRAPFEDETPEIFNADELAAAWGVKTFDPKLLARVAKMGVVREIWGPFDKAGRPESDWPKVREALDRMRPLASDALLAMFQITMGESTE